MLARIRVLRASSVQDDGKRVRVTPNARQRDVSDAQEIPDAHVGVRKRAAQSIPPGVRRLVMQRDSGRCCVPGCRHSIFVDVHHIDPRAEHGGHEPENLIVLCAAHHRALHRGSLVVEGRPASGLRFRHADGSKYDKPASPEAADESAKVFVALKNMGFRQKEARAAVERAHAHVGREAPTESLLRRALAELTR